MEGTVRGGYIWRESEGGVDRMLGLEGGIGKMACFTLLWAR